MVTGKTIDALDVRPRRARARRWSGSLLVLVTVDVMAFTAAAWLMLETPEAFDTAAKSLNANAPAKTVQGPRERRAGGTSQNVIATTAAKLT